MLGLEELLKRAVEPRPDALERLRILRLRRHRARRVATGLTAVAVAATGAASVFFAFREARVAPPPAARLLVARVTARISLPHPPQVVSAGEGAVWAIALQTEDEVTNTLYRVDPTTSEVTEVELGGSNPVDVAVGSGAVWVVVCHDPSASSFECPENRSSILRVDPGNAGILAEIPMPGLPHSVLAQGSVVWVEHFQDPDRFGISRIDPTTNRVARTVEGDYQLVGVSEGTLWAARIREPEEVVRLDSARGEVLERLDLSGCGLAVSPGALWVVREDNLRGRCGLLGRRVGVAIHRYGLASGRLEARIPLPERELSWIPELFADARSLWYVTTGAAPIIGRIDPASNRLAGPSVRVEPGPTGHLVLGFGPSPVDAAVDGGSLWVADYYDAQVVRIDLVRAPPAGEGPAA